MACPLIRSTLSWRLSIATTCTYRRYRNDPTFRCCKPNLRHGLGRERKGTISFPPTLLRPSFPFSLHPFIPFPYPFLQRTVSEGNEGSQISPARPHHTIPLHGRYIAHMAFHDGVGGHCLTGLSSPRIAATSRKNFTMARLSSPSAVPPRVSFQCASASLRPNQRQPALIFGPSGVGQSVKLYPSLR